MFSVLREALSYTTTILGRVELATGLVEATEEHYELIYDIRGQRSVSD